jgi:hypothetical protein
MPMPIQSTSGLRSYQQICLPKMADDGSKKTCFVISPIGGDESKTRKWADQTIKHLIAPAVEKHDLSVLRADQEDRAGIITTHIIQRLVGSELVIADLTGRNPNVFYELAVRHVTRKPLVQIIRAEEEIPFDVQGMRTVKFELNDPDVLEQARDTLESHVAAVMEEGEIDTPISQAVGQQLAIESGDPQQVQLADLSSSIQALTAEVRGSRGGRTQGFYDVKPIEGGKASGGQIRVIDFEDNPPVTIWHPETSDDVEILRPGKARPKGRSKSRKKPS